MTEMTKRRDVDNVAKVDDDGDGAEAQVTGCCSAGRAAPQCWPRDDDGVVFGAVVVAAVNGWRDTNLLGSGGGGRVLSELRVTWSTLGCEGAEAANNVGEWEHAGMLNHGTGKRTCIKRARDGIRRS